MKRTLLGLTLVAAVAFGVGPARADIKWAGKQVIHLDANDLELGPAAPWPNKGALGGEFTVVPEQVIPAYDANDPPNFLGTFSPGGPLPVPEVKQSIPGPAGVTKKYVEFRRGGGGGYGDDTSAMEWDTGAPGEITDGDSFSMEAWVYLTTDVELQTYFSIGHRYWLPAGGDQLETTNNFACAAGWVNTGGTSLRAVGMTTTNLTWVDPVMITPDYNYFAVTYDSASQTVSVYLNGVLNNSLVLGAPLSITPDQPVYLGATWFSGNAKCFQQGLKNGGISKLRVHDEVLSADDVKNNYDFEKFDYQVNILTFGLPGEKAAIDGTDIAWSVPFGTDLTALAPIYTVSPLVTSAAPASGSTHDFTNPVQYTITAENGTTKTYTVTVSVRGKYDGLLADTYNDTQGVVNLDPIANLLAIPPSGTTLQTADIAYDGDVFIPTFAGLTSQETFSILWTGWFDVSKDGPGEYTFGTASDDGSVVYLDLNEDGEFQSPDELVVNNNFEQGTTTRTGTATLEMDVVRIAIGYYENGGGNSMTARYKKGSGIEWASLDPINGRMGRFFAKLESDPNSTEKDILSFGLRGLPAAINGTDIAWTVPSGTDVTKLAPEYTISPFAAGNPLPGTIRDFTAPQTYNITADDGSKKTYTVTVTLATEDYGLRVTTYDETQGVTFLNPISNLLAVPPSGTTTQLSEIAYPADFGFSAAFPGLTSDDTFAILWKGWFDVSQDGPGDYTFGTESDDGSVVYLDLNEDGDFDDDGELVVDNNRDQPPAVATGTVLLDMDLVRIAIACYENGGGQAMTARFKAGAGVDWASLDPIYGLSGYFLSGHSADLLTFGLPGQPAVITGTDIAWAVPPGTDLTKLSPQYTMSPLATGAPPSGTTRDFTTPQTYTISADDGTTKTYTVTVTFQAGVLFHRGDANADGTINITDGIFVLNFLFLGGPRPTCMEAANPNDDAMVNITDGIYILNFLFLGGLRPTSPGPVDEPCGLDPPDGSELGCDAYTKC